MTTRPHRLIAALFASLLVLAACGDDGGDEADGTTTTAAAQETDATDDTETTETTAETTETTETTEGGSSGGSGFGFDAGDLAAIDHFCDLESIGENIEFDLFDDAAATPDQIQDGIDAMSAIFARGNQLAPPEISEDFATLTRGMADLIGVLSDYDFNFMELMTAAEADPELEARFNSLNSPELIAASDNVEAWIEANCG